MSLLARMSTILRSLNGLDGFSCSMMEPMISFTLVFDTVSPSLPEYPGVKKYLKGKNLSTNINSQKIATERVISKKKISFRSFEIKKRDEKTLGELFSFFILETILLGKCLKVNPYDQPAVELIKMETKKLLI